MCEYEMKCREIKILSVCMCVMIFHCVGGECVYV